MKKKKILCFVIFVGIILMLSGCYNEKDSKNKTRIVLTTGFKANEIFRIEKMSCLKPEMMLYLMNTKNEYQKAYGEKIWEVEYGGEKLEDNIKETVLERLARIKALNLYAIENKISLSEDESNKVNEAADIYFESLNDKEKELLEIDKELVIQMYKEYALAEKVYDVIVSDINPEISDDEARTITIQYILIKTYSINKQGERVVLSNEQKATAYKKALEALKRARNNEKFEQLIVEYSEDEKSEVSFGKGVMDATFEEVAFNLATNEISDIIETEFGYHIIKCVSTFDKAETDKNKIKIVEQQQNKAFNDIYSDFVSGLIKNVDEKKWNKITFIDDENMISSNFFEVYNSVFKNVDIIDE